MLCCFDPLSSIFYLRSSDHRSSSWIGLSDLELHSLQITDQRVDLFVRQLYFAWADRRGHDVTRLDRTRVVQPELQILGRIAQRATGDDLAAAYIGQVWAGHAQRLLEAADLVAADAAFLDENLLDILGRCRRCGLLLGQPALKRVLRHSDNSKTHHGVLLAAELGAQPTVDTGLLSHKRQIVLVARDGIGLTGQLRHPEAMDHILPSHLERDIPADRDV